MKYRLNYANLCIKLCLLSVLTVSLLFFPTASDLAATTSNFDNENEEEDESMTTITSIRAKLHLTNLDIQKYDEIKIVGYLNGEGQVTYLDLKEQNMEKKWTGSNPSLITDLKFNKNNYISNTMVDYEYFLSDYLLDGKKLTDQIDLSMYDCDGGRC